MQLDETQLSGADPTAGFGDVIDVDEVAPSARRRHTDGVVIDLRIPPPDVTASEPPAAAPTEPAETVRPRVLAADSMTGRFAVVTGGGTEPGRSVAVELAAAGARVCVLGRDVASLRETVELAGSDARILFMQCDVGSVVEIGEVVDFLERIDRPVDLLVHTETVQVPGGIEHGSVGDLDEQYLVNVRGRYVLSQRLLEPLRAARGHVVFVNGARHDASGGDLGQFNIAGRAVEALADALRSEAESDGVRVTSIHRGPTAEKGAAVMVAEQLADCVLEAVRLAERIDVTDLRVRPRPDHSGERVTG
ncbi:MAG: SDR family oxidoreductase [Microthrixaceae bacterium]